MIPTRVHGILDYLMGAILIAAPWVLGFAEGGLETWIPVVLGAGVIVYSLMTNYELGVVRIIPMTGHLVLDAVSGAFLAASPWLLQFDDQVWIPHLVFGLAEVGAALLTQRHPSFEAPTHYRQPAA